jgi:hypothetical protein
MKLRNISTLLATTALLPVMSAPRHTRVWRSLPTHGIQHLRHRLPPT